MKCMTKYVAPDVHRATTLPICSVRASTQPHRLHTCLICCEMEDSAR